MSDAWLSGRTVLITGAHGFIGSWLTQRALAGGASVVVLRRAATSQSRFHTEGLEQHCKLADAHLSDLDGMLRLLREHRVSAVFHIAAQPLMGLALESPRATFEANIRGTYTLLEACRLAETERDDLEAVVVASSANVYGAAGDAPLAESAPLEPGNPQDVSKAAGDMIARSYARAYGLPVAVARLTNVFGGGDLNWSRIVPATARSLAHGERPLVRSDGTPEHDFIYVVDAVEAYLTLARTLERPELCGRSWNIGAAETRSVMEVVRGLIDASGADVEPDVGGGQAPAGLPSPQQPRIDSTAIRRELGWQPRWRFEHALAETYAWYERNVAGLL